MPIDTSFPRHWGACLSSSLKRSVSGVSEIQASKTGSPCVCFGRGSNNGTGWVTKFCGRRLRWQQQKYVGLQSAGESFVVHFDEAHTISYRCKLRDPVHLTDTEHLLGSSGARADRLPHRKGPSAMVEMKRIYTPPGHSPDEATARDKSRLRLGGPLG